MAARGAWLSEARRSNARTDFFVRYRLVDAGERGSRKGTVREYRRRNGVLVGGSDALLEEPLPPLRALAHRYRTFDVAYSPCRH